MAFSQLQIGLLVLCVVAGTSRGAPTVTSSIGIMNGATMDMGEDTHKDMTGMHMDMTGMPNDHQGHNSSAGGHTMDNGHGSHGNGEDGVTHDPGDHGSHEPEDHGGHDPENGGHGSGHLPYFYFGVDSIILFRDWITDDWKTLLGSCIGLGCLSIFYEGFKVFRETLLRRQLIEGQGKRRWSAMCSFIHIFQSFLHIFQVTLSYGLMLVFMTFNVWLCLAVVVGAGIGYFLFGWKRLSIVDSTEHCH